MNRSITPHHCRHGAALVISLCFMALLAAVVLGFLSTARTEVNSADTFSSATRARQLNESAVNVVIGQIQEATSRENGAWASQPGMIRVYREEGKASNRLEAMFKLYSSNRMIVQRKEAASFHFANEVPTGASGWNHQRALFTDLNEPVRTFPNGQAGESVERYPIIDPRAFTEKGTDGKSAVEGFELVADQADDSGRLARMPVRWIYVLRDGTLTSPSSSDREGKSAVWDKGTEKSRLPTKANPIVGRIAFWADDETSKVNINTAGGHIWKQDQRWLSKNGLSYYREQDYAGSYWDTPRFYNYFDRGGDLDQATGLIKPNHIGGLATTQPLSNEFQRYPGHPMVTSLGLVFQNYLNAEQIYSIVPRITGGDATSLGGTRRFITKTYWDPQFPDARLLGGQPVPIKEQRLYASVDELLFSPKADPQGNRILNDTILSADGSSPAGILTPDLIDKTRFFLTANSRAPELNLFGRPRITIWPVDTDPKRRTAEDELIAFCSTVGPEKDRRPFLFQRHDPYSATNYANISRNRRVYDYLRELTSAAVPGFGGSTFLSKYQGERNQILTEIQDYIRCTNLRDPSRSLEILKKNGSPAPGSSAWTKAQVEIESAQFAPRGIVVPLKVNRDGDNTVGFGRISTVSQAALVLYHAGYVGVKPDKKGEYRYLDPRLKEARGVQKNLIRAFLILETFNPMQGYAGVKNAADSPNRMDVSQNNLYIHEVTGLDAFTIKSANMDAAVNLGFPRRGRNRLYYASAGWHSRSWGGYEGFSHTMLYKGAIQPGSAMFPAQEYYPFQTDGPGVEIPAEDEYLQFSGGEVEVQAFFGNRFARKIKLSFPSANWPVPTDDIWLDEGGFDRYQAPDSWKWICNNAHGAWAANPLDLLGDAPAKTLGGRIQWVYHKYTNSNSPYQKTPAGSSVAEVIQWETNHWRNIIQPGDVVRSLIASGTEDPRNTALNFKDTVFVPHPNYSAPFQPGVNGPDGKPLPIRHAHLLRVAAGVPYMGRGDRGDKAHQAWRANQEQRGTFGGYWPGAAAHPQTTYDYPQTTFGNLVALPAGKAYPSDKAANLPPGINGVRRSDGGAADFDTGIANLPDGAYAGKADEGTNMWGAFDSTRGVFDFDYPYYERDREVFDTFFSANRQVPSAVLFGSLLAGRKRPWETLSFAPNPAGTSHHGNDSGPKDHLLLDLFHMPIVRPYAISEPFSTGGKVNMNYQIAPFTYIKRSTAVRAALESVRVPAVAAVEVNRYKSGAGTTNYRNLVDRDEMVKSFDDYFDRFDHGAIDDGIFKSASQICERFLYPRDANVSGRKVAFDSRGDRYVKAFWEQNTLTGDNLRERPYADLYPRLTTKSNTFTVHVRAQVLRKASTVGQDDAKAARWDEDKDAVLAEYRGSTVIERYLDPADRRFNRQDPETLKRSDYLDPDAASLEAAYRFRVISSKRFSPW